MVETCTRRIQPEDWVCTRQEKIVADALSRLTKNGNQETTHESTYTTVYRLLWVGNQETTHESTYTTETMSELYNIKELPEGTFPLSLNRIDRYQQGRPHPNRKLKWATYQKSYFRGGRNTIELITYKDKIVITYKLQKYVVKWYHMYLLHTGMEWTEAMICQYLYWPGIREDFQRGVTWCDTCQCTKRSTKNTLN